MKMWNITDIDGLFKVIDRCSGKVELVTDNGDRLNLKSKMSQFVALAKTFSGGKIDEVELETHEPDDVVRLINYMIGGVA